MTYALGLGIILLLICLIIYVSPNISNKNNLFYLILLTTLAFILSSFMGKLYSPLIGFGIFLLLIGSLSLLIGKKHTWLEGFTKKNYSSRRKRYKDTLVVEGSPLDNLLSIDDHLLFQKYKDDNEQITQIFGAELQSEKYSDMKQNDKNSSYLEVATSTEDLLYDKQLDSHLHEVQDKIIDEKIEEIENYDNMNQKITMSIASDELSDQWMEKRLLSLFEEENSNNHVTEEKTLEKNNIPNDSRYDDLSEGYFTQVRSEKDGTKE